MEKNKLIKRKHLFNFDISFKEYEYVRNKK